MAGVNISLILQWLVLAAVILAVVGFVLGKRKTGKPVLTALSLGISAFVPIVAVVYLIFLLNKPDINPAG
ncbi:hypothetical protein [Alteromonas lipolytica]|uniref:Uncharacterized protein n=1 Tax=Alteromonas lipolytica TaxID=1856405 RepID=A0A1E8FCH1_9ALTE|nr:hypothetical protein [Alteromonas lipolytica]OFI33599.1 hypothetical protein BFC17_02840 [Alteromonas lipolytica]GGF61562.1 hypothetical protein GCM10011338_12330 [Alteromonas lipolytica]